MLRQRVVNANLLIPFSEKPMRLTTRTKAFVSSLKRYSLFSFWKYTLCLDSNFREKRTEKKGKGGKGKEGKRKKGDKSFPFKSFQSNKKHSSYPSGSLQIPSFKFYYPNKGFPYPSKSLSFLSFHFLPSKHT